MPAGGGPDVDHLGLLARRNLLIALIAEPGLAGLGPKLSPRLRRHGPVHPRASAKVVVAKCARFRQLNMINAPGHLVTTAEIVGRCHHYVIPMSLTAPDARAAPPERYRPESSSNLACARPPLCWFRCLSLMLGQSPTGGLIRLRRPRPSAPPSSSGLGHRPFKAAARVRIPLGARAGYGCKHEVL